MGFCPPDRVQLYAYGLRAVQLSILPESLAALPGSGSASISINWAGT
jgi:hypothetical protein